MGGLYQSQILILPSLSINRYENIFKVYNDDDDKMFYNLNTSVTFPDNIDPAFMDTFKLDRKVSWTVISYNIYGSIYLWWTITELNKISNPVIIPDIGRNYNYIKPQYIETIVDQINNLKNA
jgi:hypothetical protein|tara:strand:+ start:1526 stop:1891 length:366 start_codon:yes stop_codon:yes gene_type:complete